MDLKCSKQRNQSQKFNRISHKAKLTKESDLNSMKLPLEFGFQSGFLEI